MRFWVSQGGSQPRLGLRPTEKQKDEPLSLVKDQAKGSLGVVDFFFSDAAIFPQGGCRPFLSQPTEDKIDAPEKVKDQAKVAQW